MFVKNFYMKLAVDLTQKNQETGIHPHGFGSNYSDVTDYYIGYSYAYTGFDVNYITSSGLSSGVLFGDGDTPVTVDDYNIKGNRITNLTVSSNSVVNYSDSNKATMTVNYTVTNNNATDVTIKEIAMFKMTQKSGSNNTAFYLMLDRTVLDSPVTIEAGGIGQVTYTIDMNYPTA